MRFLHHRYDSTLLGLSWVEQKTIEGGGNTAHKKISNVIRHARHNSLYTKSPDPPFPWDWRVWPARLCLTLATGTT